MTTPAKTIAILCITTYPAGVARNSFIDVTVLPISATAAAAAAAVFALAAALLAAAGFAAAVATSSGGSRLGWSRFFSKEREHGANDG
jgi:hypothetical protein